MGGVELIELYDRLNQKYSNDITFKGARDDVLLEDSIEVIASYSACATSDNIKIIFRASDTKLLDYVDEKLTVSVRDSPSEDIVELIKKMEDYKLRNGKG